MWHSDHDYSVSYGVGIRIQPYDHCNLALGPTLGLAKRFRQPSWYVFPCLNLDIRRGVINVGALEVELSHCSTSCAEVRGYSFFVCLPRFHSLKSLLTRNYSFTAKPGAVTGFFSDSFSIRRRSFSLCNAAICTIRFPT